MILHGPRIVLTKEDSNMTESYIWELHFCTISKGFEKVTLKKTDRSAKSLTVLICYIQHKSSCNVCNVSGVFTSPNLDTDQFKMALWARKVSGAFERQVPGH